MNSRNPALRGVLVRPQYAGHGEAAAGRDLPAGGLEAEAGSAPRAPAPEPGGLCGPPVTESAEGAQSYYPSSHQRPIKYTCDISAHHSRSVPLNTLLI